MRRGAHAEHWLPCSTAIEPERPWPAATVVGPDQLQCPNVRTTECDRPVHVCVGMFHLDDLDDRTGALCEVLTGRENVSLHGISGDAVQQPPRPRWGQTGHQQFGQAPIMQTDCVRVWGAVDLDVLYCPTVLLHPAAQFLEVILLRGAGVVANPSTWLHLPVIVTASVRLWSDNYR